MPCLAGVLLDVSGSMTTGVSDGTDFEEGTWTRSVLTVIDDLIQYDVSETNLVFVFGIGARYGERVTDILGTMQQFQKEEIVDEDVSIPAKPEIIEEIFKILEESGARTVRKWVSTETVSKVVSNYMAILILSKLHLDPEFTRTFVQEHLPAACRDWPTEDKHSSSKKSSFRAAFSRAVQDIGTLAVTTFVKGSESDVNEILEKVKNMMLKGVCDKCIYRIQRASEILKGCVGEDDADAVGPRSRHLFKMFEPFIFGRSPLFSGIAEAAKLFVKAKERYPDHEKVLFILSDGSSTENTDIRSSLSELKDCQVTIVSCYISKWSKVDGKKLFCKYEKDWEEGAKFLFDISSKIPTNMITRAVLVKRGWKIDIENNETRLFLHVTQQDNLRDACELARNLIGFNDALIDFLASISLDLYLNQANQSIRASHQIGHTCYAHAAATVLHLAMKKILGRDGGCPDFESLKDDLIHVYGLDGADTLAVLHSVCPNLRLHCRPVNTQGAKEAICSKRPVVATFRLTDGEWEKFEQFFHKHPTGILKKRDLDIRKREKHAITIGHSVVLTSYNSECFRLMNSWGENWANMGFFNVETPEVLDLEFIDVYWTQEDLSERERAYHRAYSSKTADKFLRSLASLQVAHYACPLCKQLSLVKEFNGTPSKVKCPKCDRDFPSHFGHGNLLALDFYLKSLSVVENSL